MTEQRIRYLFQRYFSDACTEAERMEFLHLMKDSENDGEILRVMEECWGLYAPDRKVPEATRKKVLTRTLGTSRGKVRSMWGGYRARIASVAAVLLLLVTAIFFYTEKAQKKIHPQDTAATVHTIVPGGNKAVLTLSNGQQIVLDNAAEGKLAEQGGSRIIKLDSGQLAYQGNQLAAAEMAYNTISTPNGGHYAVVLSDGTKVWLNAASSLTFPAAFKGDKREVELTGEGYFEVAKNSFKPFYVKVNNMRVAVLGTSFNIMAYPEEDAIRTTLLDGAIRLTCDTHERVLTPGQQASWNGAGAFQIVKDADPEEAVAWKNGRFQFSSTNIQVIMRQLARWYDVKVKYEGNVKEESFSGSTPMAEDVFQMLKMLELTHTIHFEVNNKTITVQQMK